MSVKKPALGRGLDALFGSGSGSASATIAVRTENAPSPTPIPSGSVGLRQIPIEEIIPNPFQPRSDFDPEKLADLVASVKEKGILQPLILRGRPGAYQLVAGERRWRAAQQAGLRQVPAIIKDYSDREMTEAAIIENIQRDDLNPIEEARAYETLSIKFEMTQETIATGVGKSRAAIANSLRLLRLPEEVIALIKEDKITAGQARPLLALESAEQQIALAREIVDKGLNARDSERISKQLGNGSKHHKSSKTNTMNGSISDIQEKISLQLGMKVKISPRSNTSGKVEVFYSSLDDFQKICDHFGVTLSNLL